MLRTWVQVKIHIFVLLMGITPFEAGLAVLAVPVVRSSFNLKLPSSENLRVHRHVINRAKCIM